MPPVCDCLSSLTKWTSFTMIVTRLAWCATKLHSDKKFTKYASQASCRHPIADDCQRRSVLYGNSFIAISLTSRANGAFLSNSSVDLWYFLISFSTWFRLLGIVGFLFADPTRCGPSYIRKHVVIRPSACNGIYSGVHASSLG